MVRDSRILDIMGKCGDSMGYDKVISNNAATRKKILEYSIMANNRKLWVSYGYERIAYWRVMENINDMDINTIHIDCVKIGNRCTFNRGFDNSLLGRRFIRKKWLEVHDVEMYADYLRSIGKDVVFCNCVNGI